MPHPHSLVNLEANKFKPGQSGNPSGLPRGTVKLTPALGKLLRTPAGETYEAATKGDEVVLALYEKAKRGDVAAIGMIFDRIEGKLSQNLNLTAGSQSDQELAHQMFEGLIESGKSPEQARALLVEVGVDANDID